MAGIASEVVIPGPRRRGTAVANMGLFGPLLPLHSQTNQHGFILIESKRSKEERQANFRHQLLFQGISENNPTEMRGHGGAWTF